jgi:putative ABC transport system substrate-binding protein
VKRRELLMLLGAAATVWPLGARAQQRQMRVIGFLHGGPATQTIPSNSPFVAALENGLKEIGYASGENVKIEYSVSVDDLIRDKAEVIIVASGASIRGAKSATTSIPLIMNITDDPVSEGLVTSLNRPSGNITGVSLLSSELMPKRLEMLRELVPKAKTCAVLITPRSFGVEARATLQTAADRMGIALDIVSAQAQSEFEPAFVKIGGLKSDALLVTTHPLFTSHPGSLVDLAARYAVPTSYPWREFVLAGGLISYAPSLVEAYHQLGIYAGKILNGAKAADLPIEQPVKFELAINLRTANALGLTAPQSLLLRADEVIE